MPRAATPRHSSPLRSSDNLYISAASCSPSLPRCNTALKEHSQRFSARGVEAFTAIKADVITAYLHLCGREENDRCRSSVLLPQPTTCVCVPTCVSAALPLSFCLTPLSRRLYICLPVHGFCHSARGCLLMTPVRQSVYPS